MKIHFPCSYIVKKQKQIIPTKSPHDLEKLKKQNYHTLSFFNSNQIQNNFVYLP